MIECCSELAQMKRDGYEPKDWGAGFGAINQWGGNPPLRFRLTGFPIATPTPGRPPWAMRPDRTPTAA
jgi:hypothetical protein